MRPRGLSPALRERFDDGRQPAMQALPYTHHRDWYLATDASCRAGVSTLGAIAEAADGTILGRWHTAIDTDDNNRSELLALHYGLDRLAASVPTNSRIGILLDHDGLAEAICRWAHAGESISLPYRSASPYHWAGVQSRIQAFADVRVSLVGSDRNPAHELVNPSISISSDTTLPSD